MDALGIEDVGIRILDRWQSVELGVTERQGVSVELTAEILAKEKPNNCWVDCRVLRTAVDRK